MLLKETFSSEDDIIAHFPVGSGVYNVNVFVFDKFTNDIGNIEKSLAKPQKLKCKY